MVGPPRRGCRVGAPSLHPTCKPHGLPEDSPAALTQHHCSQPAQRQGGLSSGPRVLWTQCPLGQGLGTGGRDPHPRTMVQLLLPAGGQEHLRKCRAPLRAASR